MKISTLLNRKSKWTKSAFARDIDGKVVKHNSPEAVCWCLSGAVDKCYPDSAKNTEVRKAIHKELGHCGMMFWNDNLKTTYTQVRTLVRKLKI